MNTTLPENCWRSEAFAEDLVVDETPQRSTTLPLAWLSALPLAVAVLGVAFALWPAA
ncbi:MAG: hypothetical protein KF683_23695 [Rubrivivax sp.]|nr:hypothetical protein [Rubrivivax sp.]MBX3638386.1 hypothetical protein [Rubrivivax sp.]